jgi:hypothetical protein
MKKSVPMTEGFEKPSRILLEGVPQVPHIQDCQGPRNVDLRTPPGPEGSNGSLLDICRGHPGIFSMQNEKLKIEKTRFASPTPVFLSDF